MNINADYNSDQFRLKINKQASQIVTDYLINQNKSNNYFRTNSNENTNLFECSLQISDKQDIIETNILINFESKKIFIIKQRIS